MSRPRNLQLPAVNGSLELITEPDGSTFVSCWTSPGFAATVLRNTSETRRFLRRAIKRLDAAKRTGVNGDA
jgi:hypothetical protein